MQYIYCFAYSMSHKGIGLSVNFNAMKHEFCKIQQLDMEWYGKISGAMNIARWTIG